MENKMKLPTKEKLKKYIKNLGTNCPVCGSDQIEGGNFDHESGQVWQKMSCNECEGIWTDVYFLKKVEIWGVGEILVVGEL